MFTTSKTRRDLFKTPAKDLPNLSTEDKVKYIDLCMKAVDVVKNDPDDSAESKRTNLKNIKNRVIPLIVELYPDRATEVLKQFQNTGLSYLTTEQKREIDSVCVGDRPDECDPAMSTYRSHCIKRNIFARR